MYYLDKAEAGESFSVPYNLRVPCPWETLLNTIKLAFFSDDW